MNESVKRPAVFLSSRQFNQDTAGAKRAAESGPVIITDRGQPAYVLISYEAYGRLVGSEPNIVDLLAQTDAESDFEFDPPQMKGSWLKAADLD